MHKVEQVVLNNDYIVIANTGWMTCAIDVFKISPRRWTSMDLFSYFYEHSAVDGDCGQNRDVSYVDHIFDKRAEFENMLISDSSLALLVSR